ncbi:MULTISPECIES: hypothetical protein [unclassified Streptomyces]|uniref:hypothetical protein n=1 Tax=unclassified Streptomyces TaxID=2593676 RepID=UPI002E26ACBE|nr:hypothetical protein OG296_39060 [Streptomyces sp. NBC_01001]
MLGQDPAHGVGHRHRAGCRGEVLQHPLRFERLCLDVVWRGMKIPAFSQVPAAAAG